MRPHNFPKKCPECHSTKIEKRRSIFRILLGMVLIFLGIVFAIPTVGLSLVLLLWGVFLTAPRPACAECGWKGEYR